MLTCLKTTATAIIDTVVRLADGPTSLDFDIDGRIRELGDMHFDYVSFTDRLREIGTIDIDYVSFSEHPRRIGPIEFDWAFGELRRVAGVDVE